MMSEPKNWEFKIYSSILELKNHINRLRLNLFKIFSSLLELKNHEPVKTKSFCSAGRTTTNEELEDMLEQGNPAVFTQVKNMIIL